MNSVGFNLRLRNAGDDPGPEGATPQRATPLGLEGACGFCHPQVKTCGYSRSAPSGAGIETAYSSAYVAHGGATESIFGEYQRMDLTS